MNNTEKIKLLKAEAISGSTQNAYLLSIVNFIMFLHKFNPHEPGAIETPYASKGV
jgi:hypothetical protein